MTPLIQIVPSDEENSPLSRGEFLREAFFYGGESAYWFQYRDFALEKFGKDDKWLKANKGFGIDDARLVFDAVCDVLRANGEIASDEIRRQGSDNLNLATVLAASTFTTSEVSQKVTLAPLLVEMVLLEFSSSAAEKNSGFTAISDFNIAVAKPLLLIRESTFVLLNICSLAEALYEGPFYWMLKDDVYRDDALNNRGDFAERMCFERLVKVFGHDRVHAGVKLIGSKEIAGEIDVLIFFGNRAIIVQAKSKRLTLEARKGNDRNIQGDFKNAIQDAYDQGVMCAGLLEKEDLALVDKDSKRIRLAMPLKEIYIFCVVSDHYPGLSFQARQFLRTQSTEKIPPPFVMDLFLLDAMTEMLESPLRLLSYVNRRTQYDDQFIADHELTILAYHLKQNLWLRKDIDLVQLDASIAVDLDISMYARREGALGSKVPDGILTRLSDTSEVASFV